VVKKFSRVNYKIRSLSRNGKQKVVHLNNVKKYVEREECVRALMVVAEDVDEEYSMVKLRIEECEGYAETELTEELDKWKHVLRSEPGETDVVTINIQLEPGTKTIFQQPYRIPDKLKERVRKEIQTLP